jgi:hypothetical protein
MGIVHSHGPKSGRPETPVLIGKPCWRSRKLGSSREKPLFSQEGLCPVYAFFAILRQAREVARK